jgi:hypothetical protein
LCCGGRFRPRDGWLRQPPVALTFVNVFVCFVCFVVQAFLFSELYGLCVQRVGAAAA